MPRGAAPPPHRVLGGGLRRGQPRGPTPLRARGIPLLLPQHAGPRRSRRAIVRAGRRPPGAARRVAPDERWRPAPRPRRGARRPPGGSAERLASAALPVRCAGHVDTVALWRHHHALMASREIGIRQGTGGSLGVAYLQTTLDRRFFPDLWE